MGILFFILGQTIPRIKMSHILFQTCICLNTFKGKHEFLRKKKIILSGFFIPLYFLLRPRAGKGLNCGLSHFPHAHFKIQISVLPIQSLNLSVWGEHRIYISVGLCRTGFGASGCTQPPPVAEDEGEKPAPERGMGLSGHGKAPRCRARSLALLSSHRPTRPAISGAHSPAPPSLTRL